MREDLVGGLKNALERGVALEAAIRSFVSAGYKEADVREAARDLDTGSVYLEQAASSPTSPTTRALPVIPQALPQRPIQKPMPQRAPQGRGSLILVTVLAIILVLSVAAFLASILFKEQIAAFFH